MKARQKRAIREAKETLWKNGVTFSVANGELHFMLSHQCRRIDFWPTSGKWIARGYRNYHGSGISTLLEYLGVKQEA